MLEGSGSTLGGNKDFFLFFFEYKTQITVISVVSLVIKQRKSVMSIKFAAQQFQELKGSSFI